MCSLLDWAIRYSKIGWFIFPLSPNSKIPLPGSHGVSDATNNEDTIRKWWDVNQSYNIGLACGVKSGIYVIDIDVDKEKGVNGYESLKEFPELPKTLCQNTPRGGIHALYKTSNPPANRNSFRNGIDIRGDGYYIVLTPSIISDCKRYSWIDAKLFEKESIAEFPDFMRPVKRMPWDQEEIKKDIPLIIKENNNTIIERAKLYLSKCDPAIQGSGGHNKLLWAAVSLIHGFGLSDSECLELLSKEYNPRCNPQWNLCDKKDYRDFTRKISEARKLNPQKQSGWLLNEIKTQDITANSFDIDRIIENSPIYQKKVKIAIKKNLDTELEYLIKPCGMVGELCEWINITAIRQQPFLSLACSLAFLGALFGRKIKDSTGIRTNLYTMGVAHSSAGKAHAMNCIRRLCEYTGAGYLLGGDSIASDSSIEERISREPATLFLWDEIGHLLSYIRSGVSKHYGQVVSLLMKLYSTSGSVYKGKEYAESEKQRTIIEPCCCIYGTSTPERFTDGITQAELRDGWLSRCLVFYSSDNPDKNRNIFCHDIPKNISEFVQRFSESKNEFSIDGHSLSNILTGCYNNSPLNQITIKANIGAERRFILFDNEANKFGSENKQIAPLWYKGEENARKIALILAAGNESIINEQIADYSCRLVKYLLQSFEYTIMPEITDNIVAKNKRKVFNIINDSGINGTSKCDLAIKTEWLTKRVREEIITDLQETCEVVYSETKEKGNFRYWSISNYRKYLKENEVNE